MTEEKARFILTDFPELVRGLSKDEKGRWGVMNGIQMIEHMSDSIRIASGKDPKKLLFNDEQVKKAREFMLSEKPFKENTKNIELPDVPPPPRNSDINGAVKELKTEISDFFSSFRDTEQKTVMNPFFGPLTYDEWVHLLHKHAVHHLKQFGLVE
jgi:hypothetical protein